MNRAPRKGSIAAAARLLTSVSQEGQDADPLIALWQDWRETFASSQRLCQEAQRLERELAERIGFPRVEVTLEDPEHPRSSPPLLVRSTGCWGRRRLHGRCVGG